MTQKLYDTDAYLQEFSATVLSCENHKDGYAVTLDQTAFFPEEGGQGADHGSLSEASVLDAFIKDGVIFHITDKPLAVGKTVQGKIDWERRFRHMQHHTGEHILSGTLHRLFGAENVGFHLYNEVTLDTDIPLDEAMIERAEREANEAVFANLSVKAEYPEASLLATLTYRAKLSLTEGVRIVTIEGVDACACCAPHLKQTGEVGLIKIVDFMKYKGGTRLFIRCGKDALADYREKQALADTLCRRFSAKGDKLYSALDAHFAECEEKKAEIARLENTLREARLSPLPETKGILPLFYPDLSQGQLRKYAEEAASLCDIAAVFTKEGEGYRYCLSSQKEDVRPLDKRLHERLGGRGGGRSESTAGSLPSNEEEIRRVLAEC